MLLYDDVVAEYRDFATYAAGDSPCFQEWALGVADDEEVLAWLGTLPPRKRQLAELLAEGHETGVVAGMVGVSSGRVSQVRHELAESWREFQAQAVAV